MGYRQLKSPLISIITITLNAEKYLEQTIQSVLNQTYKNIEYIVVDGGSTDGTLGIIEKYENAIDHIISEKDDGIADAMNKGATLAKGEYVIFFTLTIISCMTMRSRQLLKRWTKLRTSWPATFNMGCDKVPVSRVGLTFGSILSKESIIKGFFADGI